MPKPRRRIRPAEVSFPCKHEPRNTYATQRNRRLLLHTSHSGRRGRKSEYINIIENNNQLLLQLISDVLDIAKIEAGSLDFNYSSLDLNVLMNELESTALMRITSPDVCLEMIPDNDNCWVITERNRLSQIIINLLNNAIKFTQKGKITFGYKLQKEKIYFM